MIKKLFCLLFTSLLIFTFGCKDNGDNYSIIMNEYNGKEVSICHRLINEYLSLTDEAEICEFLDCYSERELIYQCITLSWNSTGSSSYTVYVSNNSDFSNALIINTNDTQVTPSTLIPGMKYYWKIKDSNNNYSKVDTFITKEGLRPITAEGGSNIRDIGGWTTESGKKVNYGLIYRGAMLNGYNNGPLLTENGINVFNNELKIKSEIDLRVQNGDDGNQSSCFFNVNNNYIKAAYSGYCYIFPSFSQTEPKTRKYQSAVKQSYKRIFAMLADSSNYPVYFHCNQGADRTGTLAYIINGLLGVSFEDLTRDFELTSFSYGGKRFRDKIKSDISGFVGTGVFQDDMYNYVAWNKMNTMMMNDYGTGDGKLSSAIANYLTTVCNVTNEEIASVKSIMLG